MQEKPITNLEPILVPEPVSFWPPQPGWYVVIGILVTAIIYGLYTYIQYKKRNRYRKDALLRLQAIQNNGFPIPDPEKTLQLNRLLKVTAILGYSRKEVASLTGKPWIDFLQRTCNKVRFSEGATYLLTNLDFVPADRYEISEQEWLEVVNLSKRWIKHHKVKSK